MELRGHLLINAGFCQLCRGGAVAITSALETYQDLAAAVDEEDVAKFTEVVREYNSMACLDAWRTTLLSRVKYTFEGQRAGGG